MTLIPAYTNLHKSSRKLAFTFTLIKGIVGLIVFHLTFSGCFEETFVSNQAIDIGVSMDTVRFDTVFTSVGSTTKSLIVYNRSSQNVNISSIKIGNGSNSNFRINVDGNSGNSHQEIPILAGDSLYVFVEVTVDPDLPLSESPFVIYDQLIISSGESQKSVLLEAWGQNANYFPFRDAGGQLIGLGCNGGDIVWDDPKPYVIYGLLFIDSCQLIIPAGTRIYFHGGLGSNNNVIFNDGSLLFLENANLITEGTVEQPVLMTTDRLEEEYQELPGQWAGIRFLPNSKNNRLSHTEIRNSVVGIRADSSSQVFLEGVKIAHTSNVGLIGSHANIEVVNSLIHDNGPQSIALVYGGNYSFRYTTIANYENQSPALYMDNFECLNQECSAVSLNPLHVSFKNSIVMGSNDDEIAVNDITDGNDPEAFNLLFDHTIIKINEVKVDLPEGYCTMCLEHMGEPVFLDDFNDDYSLDTMSLARNQGVPIDGIIYDINGVLRKVEQPDIGCYEFIE